MPTRMPRSDPNPATDTGDYAGNQFLLENNVANVGTYKAAYFTTGSTVDWPDAAILDASSLYYISNGVLDTNPFASSIVVNGTSYAANKLTENGVGASSATDVYQPFPTARTLFNIISQNTVRAPAAGFNNWLCDGNKAFTKSQDPSTGTPYDSGPDERHRELLRLHPVDRRHVDHPGRQPGRRSGSAEQHL